MLNFKIYSESLPHMIILLQIAVAILLPIIVSIIPIMRSSKISINESFNIYGVEEKLVNEDNKFSRIISKFVPPIISMAVKNTFRRKGRLFLTVMTLALGGAIFISALNLKASSDNMIEKAFEKMNTDIAIYFNESYATEQINMILKGKKEIKLSEGYKLMSGTVILQDGRITPPETIVSYKKDTKLMEFEMENGVWKTDNNTVIINSSFAGKFKYKTGNMIKIKIADTNRTYIIGGILREPFSVPKIYIDKYVADNIEGKDKIEVIGINLTDNKMVTDNYVYNLINEFEKNGISVKSGMQKNYFKEKVVEHLKIIVFMLIFMTLLIVIVGGLGQVTSMSINILERQQEIGVLRAVGMENYNLYKLVAVEGIIIGVLSWIASVVVSIPASMYIGNKFARIFFETGINFKISLSGIIIWFIIIILFSLIATFYPAKFALKRNLKESLEFE